MVGELRGDFRQTSQYYQTINLSIIHCFYNNCKVNKTIFQKMVQFCYLKYWNKREIYPLAYNYKIIRQLRKILLIDMLINKKYKTSEDKNKTYELLFKKTKKNKIASPSKNKLTPEKKRKKKEEIMHFNKSQTFTNQKGEAHKSKDNSKAHQTNKNHLPWEGKSKLLTTSPVRQEHLKSNSNSKKKSNSKSRSTSRINTQRSNQPDKDKSVQKKLYYQNKENARQKSYSKSKQKSKSKTKDISPLKQARNLRQFNVADREVKLKKTEFHEIKKSLKKKVQNILKGEVILCASDQQVKQIQQPKMKLKKKVPQIKTEFSERRGSYFDENLLKKLQINHQDGKKVQMCPFSHIKSNFQEKILLSNKDIQSKSQMKAENEINQQIEYKHSEIQSFKKDQQNKWKSMLSELTKLKNSQKVPQRIDQLIQVLNRNYISLQEKATQLFKESKVIQKSKQTDLIFHQKKDEFMVRQGNQKNQLNQLKKQQIVQDSIINLPNKIIQIQDNDQNNLKSIHLQRESLLEKVNLQIEHDDSLTFDNLIVNFRSNELRFDAVPEAYEHNFLIQNNDPIVQLPSIIVENEQNDKIYEAQIPQPEFKRSNNICLNEDFFSFVESRKQSGLKKELISLISVKPSQLVNVSIDMLRQLDQHKLSDKNLLQELNIFDKSFQTSVNVVTLSQNNKCQFIEQMEQVRKRSRSFDENNKFNSEVKVHDDMSSESMLLGENTQNQKRLLNQIENILFIQFGTIILKNKNMLHNFLSTYTELVQNNKIHPENDNIATCPISCTNQNIKQIVCRLLNYFQVNYKQYFMQQIQISLECKPIDILKYIRTEEEDMQEIGSGSGSGSEEESGNMLQMPFLDLVKIQEFETEVLRNQYYIPGYFSFNHSIYDLFNQIFDNLRPYGSKGKSIFTLQIGHKIEKFQNAKELIISKFHKNIHQKYFEQVLTDQTYPNSEGIFEVMYFTSFDIIQQIFYQQCIQFMELFSKKRG